MQYMLGMEDDTQRVSDLRVCEPFSFIFFVLELVTFHFASATFFNPSLETQT